MLLTLKQGAILSDMKSGAVTKRQTQEISEVRFLTEFTPGPNALGYKVDSYFKTPGVTVTKEGAASCSREESSILHKRKLGEESFVL